MSLKPCPPSSSPPAGLGGPTPVINPRETQVARKTEWASVSFRKTSELLTLRQCVRVPQAARPSPKAHTPSGRRIRRRISTSSYRDTIPITLISHYGVTTVFATYEFARPSLPYPRRHSARGKRFRKSENCFRICRLHVIVVVNDRKEARAWRRSAGRGARAPKSSNSQAGAQSRRFPSWPPPGLTRGSSRPSTRFSCTNVYRFRDRRSRANRETPCCGSAWMAGTSPAMTALGRFGQIRRPRLERQNPNKRSVSA